ncbi:MAG: alcohol dehydrogenase catalytic domain-containing protein [Solirubrobacterales bacterium]|nr:alcohol dehydrogenase catalytic domain-containing protein [Solirubrobacterales bacterium]
MASSAAIEMQAVVLREPGRPVAVETVKLEPPRAGEVLVRVAAAGVCHSDLHLADGLLGDGRWPMVLGHEGAGVVEAVGEGVEVPKVGDYVGFCFVPACGDCEPCRVGRRALCENVALLSLKGGLMDGTSRLQGLDGTPLQHGLMVACFAEHVVVPAGGAVPLPGSIPLWQAALLGCGVVTGLGAVKRAGVRAGDSVCVIGCGGVGLQVIAGARLAQAGMIVAVDRDSEKLARALHRGATHAVDATQTEVAREVRALSGGGVQHAFEVVGDPATIRQAWRALRTGGSAIVVGVAPRGVEVALPALEFLREKSITGSFYGSGDPQAALRDVAQLVIDGRLGLEDVISDLIALDEVEPALERLRRGEGARSVILVDEQLAGKRL